MKKMTVAMAIARRSVESRLATAGRGAAGVCTGIKIAPMSKRQLVAAAVIAGAGVALGARQPSGASQYVSDPAALVNPLIGSANGGNTFPGAVVPFGMVQWSPETTRGDHSRVAAPGGYAYDAPRVRGFSLTHLSGTGCRGASGDIPFMPIASAISSSPSADKDDRVYATRFAHVNERAAAGAYDVRLSSGIKVELGATQRTGAARFTFPEGKPATLLVRVSDSEVGSSDARVHVDAAARRITGSVTSGNFCGYIDEVDRRSYYTLYFVAEFDRPFASLGTWHDGTVTPGSTDAEGGTTYGDAGYPAAGRGSGAYVTFANVGAVNVHVGISYVSEANAAANLRAESPADASLEAVRARAHDAWNRALGRVRIAGGTVEQQRVFYTALYHALLHPNLFSDANGQYRGFDGQVHTVSGRQRAQYANFSGWDVYRSQLQLVTLLEPDIASDIAQSLFNQATQNGGEWDRWTHNSGATHVMEGDPSPAAIAGIYAFGGTSFDAEGAYRSLAHAATVPTANDSSARGCPVECPGQRPALRDWMTLHYVPAKAPAWGGAGETLEDAIADFSLAQLARQLDHGTDAATFLERSGYWRNLFKDGYVRDRNADGTWPPFDPASDEGFAEGSSAQYTWMVPHDPRGLFDAMGGAGRAAARLDEFFHSADASVALTGLGGLHAEMDNEPSTAAVWLFSYAGHPETVQNIVRETLTRLWTNTPYGIPGNDDLGAMSAWYVWAALGMYPGIPGRAELLLGSPLFRHAEIARANGITLKIDVPARGSMGPYVAGLRVNGQPSSKTWLPETFVAADGTLEYELSDNPSETWGRAPADAPPSFPPR
jgi:predicted alpha-1,2-mannosidase